MRKPLSKIILIFPLLMAFQCEDDFESTVVFNEYKINITPESTFSLNDTIWVEGSVSSKAYDLSINDSIFLEETQVDNFSIMKFIEPTQSSNCIDAIDNFKLIIAEGDFFFHSVCKNAEINASGKIDNDNLFYNYRIGLIPENTGDYVISWRNGIIQNEERNEYIIDDYPLEHNPNQIGFNKCGDVSWRNLDESEREYYFNIQ